MWVTTGRAAVESEATSQAAANAHFSTVLVKASKRLALSSPTAFSSCARPTFVLLQLSHKYAMRSRKLNDNAKIDKNGLRYADASTRTHVAFEVKNFLMRNIRAKPVDSWS